MRQRALAPRLIGRQPELAELADALERARSGAGQLLMLAGEAGVGKSRLLREFVRGLAGDAAVTSVVGHCYDERPAPPYGPFAELLGRLGPEAGPALGELRRLIAAAAPVGDGDSLGDPQAERRRLFQAIHQALRPAAGRVNVLILEDLHWSDQASQDLLLHLARAVGEDRVLIVGSYRTDEIHRLHPLAALLARLARDRRSSELRLAPLSRAELAELLADTLGADPPAPLVTALYERTEGNPFFAEELLESLLAAGAPGAALPEPPLATGALPLSIKDSILRRVADLDEPTAAVLRAAAVVGRRFDFELLLRLTGLDEAALLRSLGLLVQGQLVAEEPGDSEDRYRFRHELIRQTLYEEMLRRERRIRHHEVLRALEQLHAEDADAVVDQLAYHASHARALPEAARYSLRAAERAARVHAYREALGHYEAALELGEQAGVQDEAARAELLARLGTTAYVIGERRRAGDYWREALPLYQALGERRRAADLLRWLGRAARDAGEHAAAFAQTRAALAMLEGEPPCRELAMAYSALSHLYMFEIFNRVPEAAANCIAWGERALAMAEALGDDSVSTHALNNIGVALTESGQVEAGIARLRRSLALALAADLPADAVRAYINLCGPLWEHGYSQESLALGQEALAYAAQHGNIIGSAKLLIASCHRDLDAGAFASLEARLDELLRPGADMVEDRAWLQLMRATLLVERDRLDEARELLERLLGAERGSHANKAEHLLILVYNALGAPERATAAADSLLARARAACAPDACLADLGPQACKLFRVVEQYLQIGRRDEALELLAAIEAEAVADATPRNQALAASLRGQAALPAQPDLAAAEFAAAIALLERLGFRPAVVELRRRRAQALLALSGDEPRAEAAAELRAARAAAEAIGAQYELRLIAELERAPAPAGAPRATPAAAEGRPLDALTPRELEVLALVTRGLSNRAIAEALVISEKTAEVHVRNILGKLGFSSRTQAATYAVERGLAARSA